MFLPQKEDDNHMMGMLAKAMVVIVFTVYKCIK